MKNLYLYLVLLVLSVNHTHAQNPNNHWILGTTDLNFGTNPAGVFSVSNSGNYGNATISDDNGNLLFYTNGRTVWNKNHQVMQNGSYIGVLADAIQPVVILPFPGNNKKYLIVNSNGEITLNSTPSVFPYAYSIVDFTNNPLGELTALSGSNLINVYTKLLTVDGSNIATGTMTYRPLTIAKNNDGTGYWVIAQSGKKILSYALTASGFNEIPVVTDLGGTNINTTPIQYSMFKMSPNQFRMGILEFSGSGNGAGSDDDPTNYRSYFYLIDFNSTTGQFSNLGLFDTQGVTAKCKNFEFSADSKKAYFVRFPQRYTGAGAGITEGEIIVKELAIPGSAVRKLAEFNAPASFPFNFTYLQRDKHDNLLISSTYAASNRNKYIHKIDNQNSYSGSSIVLNWINLNNKTISYLPQLIPILNNSCPSDIIRTVTESTSELYKAANSITANTNFVVNSGISTTMQAGNYILLSEQCDIKSGAVFIAEIEACSPALKGEDSEMSFSKRIMGEAAQLYPNPNNGTFTIRLTEEVKGEVSVMIYDIYGKIVHTEKQKETSFEVKAPDLATGVYLVRIEGNNYNETIKFVKK